MSRLATSFVLGYHGCDRSTAERAVRGELGLTESDKDFDWLGPGVYFWEADPLRAYEWALWKAARKDFADPAVIGAVIDLGNCLDLVARENLELVRAAYDSFMELRRHAGFPVPQNRSVPGQPNDDRILRYLDCAVLRHLHQMVASSGEIEAFDTVRGMFTEGGPLYPGAGFQVRTHVQIAVRNPRCILGVFFPKPDPAKSHDTA